MRRIKEARREALRNRGTKEKAEESTVKKKKLKLKEQMESILRQYRRQQVNEQRLEPAERTWQLQTAKARFSEVFRLARAIGPQLITRQGKEAVVVLSVEQFDQLVAQARQPASLVQFFAESPLAGVQLDLEHSKDVGREIDL